MDILITPESEHRAALLIRLLRRLEAATSRLEDIASSTSPPDGVKPGTNAAAVSRTASLNGDGPTPTQALHPQATQQSKAVSDPDLPPAIADFDTMIKDDLAPFSDLSSKLGGVIDEQVSIGPIVKLGDTRLTHGSRHNTLQACSGHNVMCYSWPARRRSQQTTRQCLWKYSRTSCKAARRLAQCERGIARHHKTITLRWFLMAPRLCSGRCSRGSQMNMWGIF